MDVIINNPPAQTAPVQTAPVQPVPVQTVPGYALPAPGYTQGYGTQGYGPAPAYPGFPPYAYGGHHGGGGFFGVFLLILGGVLLARFLRGRRFWAQRARMLGAGAKTSHTEGQDAEESSPFEFWGRQRERSTAQRALGIAAERLARGEISAEEYAGIKSALGGE